MAEQEYSGKDIQALTDREHVRLRTQIYLGSNVMTQYMIPVFGTDTFTTQEVSFVPAVYKAVGEIADNCIDELTKLNQDSKVITISAEPSMGVYSIGDNGRGIPIDMHATGVYTPQVALSQLRSGRNFSSDKEAGVIGQNGVGSACTNMCSSEFTVTIHRDNKQYVQVFSDGAGVIGEPTIKTKKGATPGTEVSFILDPQIFSDTSLPDQLLVNRAIEIAFNNPSFTVNYNGTDFKYPHGLDDILGAYVQYKTHKFQTPLGNVYLVLGANDSDDERMHTWVNSSYLYEGGKCNTQWINAFCDRVIKHFEKETKKLKITITKNDVRACLTFFATLKVSDPEYDSQSKLRLVGPCMRNIMQESLEQEWKAFVKHNNDWLQSVLQRATNRSRRRADADATSGLKQGMRRKVEGLLDANGTNRMDCMLLVCEGLSASNQIIEVRDSTTMGAFSLTGKTNNVYGASIADVLKMGKYKDLLSALGLVPGEKARRENLRFGKFVIMTDSDVDGGNIFALLVNLIYRFWPELLRGQTPYVYRMTAPNIVASKGGKRIHFCTKSEYDKQASKYKGWNIEYYKGLGSMLKEDWEMVLSDPDRYLLPIVDDGCLGDALELIFGDSVEGRKEWLR